MRAYARAIAVAWLVAVFLPSKLDAQELCGAPPDGSGPVIGCTERCELPAKTSAQPSEELLAKLRSVGTTGHHVDSAIGASLVRRESTFRVSAVSVPEETMQAWQRKRRWAGPCTGLRAFFYSKLVEDSDPKNVIEVHELQYGTEAEAKRVATLLVSSWDWNYHPYIAVTSGASVFVLEGRHRAWGSLARVGAMFGAKFRGGRQR